jgi:hypothetical protein
MVRKIKYIFFNSLKKYRFKNARKENIPPATLGPDP